MKKYLIGVYLVIISFISFGCSLNSSGAVYSGVTLGDGSVWPGLVEIYLDSKSYNLSDLVTIHYSYGHAYSEYDAEGNDLILNHDLVIYLVESNRTNIDPEEELILHEINISGDDLMDSSYSCDPGKMLWSDVEYNITEELSVDFDEYDIDYGLLVIRFSETSIMEDNIDEVIVETEATYYNQAFIYFLITDEEIEFSRSSFS